MGFQNETDLHSNRQELIGSNSKVKISGRQILFQIRNFDFFGTYRFPADSAEDHFRFGT